MLKNITEQDNRIEFYLKKKTTTKGFLAKGEFLDNFSIGIPLYCFYFYIISFFTITLCLGLTGMISGALFREIKSLSILSRLSR